MQRRFIRGGNKTVVGAKNNKVSATLSRLYVPFITKQSVGMLNRYGAYAHLIGYYPLRGQLAAIGINSLHNIATHLPIKL